MQKYKNRQEKVHAFKGAIIIRNCNKTDPGLFTLLNKNVPSQEQIHYLQLVAKSADPQKGPITDFTISKVSSDAPFIAAVTVGGIPAAKADPSSNAT